ncbi:MAG TPA: hypothetical protein VIF62_27020 [Labilithrix sp.]
MQRRADGWHLELVAFGAGRADEGVAALTTFKELRQVPLQGDGWERREFGLTFEAKSGFENQPIHVVVHAYAAGKNASFVPELRLCDGVLLAGGDAAMLKTVESALGKRLGAPPKIVEQATADRPLKDAMRALVKRAVAALKASELHAFWGATERDRETAHDTEVFGPLTKDAILARPKGDLVPFIMRVVRERGRRAVKSGRLPNVDAYERSLGTRLRRMLVVHTLESLVADGGVHALFGPPSERAMDREDVTGGVAALKRMGAAKKAAIIERALVVAREANLWEVRPDGLATKVLDELSERFYAVDDEPIGALLEESIRKAPEEFTLSAYAD